MLGHLEEQSTATGKQITGFSNSRYEKIISYNFGQSFLPILLLTNLKITPLKVFIDIQNLTTYMY